MVGFMPQRRLLGALSMACLATTAAADVMLAPDAGFSGAGVASLSSANHEAFVAAVRLADGAVVAAGNLGTAQGSDLVVARFRADGSLDPSFGLGGYSALDAGAADDTVRTLALMPDGRIAVAGQSGGRPMVAMFRADGAPDAGFGAGGVARVPLQNAARAGFAALAVQADGRLVAAGEALAAGGPRPLAARFEADGALDPSFDLDGVRVLAGEQATVAHVRLGADGAIYLAARGAGRVLVAKLAADGDTAAEFGVAGIAAAATAVSSPLAGFDADANRLLLIERRNGRAVAFDLAGNLVQQNEIAPGAEFAALARTADGTLLAALDLPAAPGFSSAIATLGASGAATVLRATVDLPGDAATGSTAAGSTAVMALHVDGLGRGVAAGYRYGGTDTDYLLAAFNVQSATAASAASAVADDAAAGGGGSADLLGLVLALAALALARRRPG